MKSRFPGYHSVYLCNTHKAGRLGVLLRCSPSAPCKCNRIGRERESARERERGMSVCYGIRSVLFRFSVVRRSCQMEQLLKSNPLVTLYINLRCCCVCFQSQQGVSGLSLWAWSSPGVAKLVAVVSKHAQVRVTTTQNVGWWAKLQALVYGILPPAKLITP